LNRALAPVPDQIYPGSDSVVLIYCDKQAHRVSRFLRFDDLGSILLPARHEIPRRRQGDIGLLGIRRGDAAQFGALKLRCEAMQTLIEARRLRPGAAGNSLRQRPHALRQLA